MSTDETSRYVRIRTELVLEVTAKGELIHAALERIGEDEFMPDDERHHATAAIQEDEAEALAYLVDPFDLVVEVPGVELVQASWSSEQTDYDPTSVEWGADDFDELEGEGEGGDPGRDPAQG